MTIDGVRTNDALYDQAMLGNDALVAWGWRGTPLGQVAAALTILIVLFLF